MKDPDFFSFGLRMAVTLFGCGLISASPPSARAQDTIVPTVVRSFDGSEGSGPGSLVEGDDGNLYGVTGSGGFGYMPGYGGSGNGTVFRITPTGELTTIHVFSGGDDGKGPHGLSKGRDGNFYGLTIGGGVKGGGTVFRITPTGELTTIYASDFLAVTGPLVQDDSGNFYGLSSIGGPETADYGSIFRLTPAGVYTTLHAFTGEDGAASSALTRGSDGNFYATGNLGGDDSGTIYRITPAGEFTSLYTFTGKTDGFLPNDLTLGSDGNLYGTTLAGGAHGYGVIFRLTNAGGFTVIHHFTGGGDSGYPVGALVAASDGGLYGVAAGDTMLRYTTGPIMVGGLPIVPEPNPPLYPNPPSTIFRVSLSGTLTTLYARNTTIGGFIQGKDGNFYGTAYNLLAPGNGSIEKLTLVPHPAFFAGQAPLPGNVEYLAFTDGNLFGYYAFLSDPHYVYHFDLGYEYLFDAQDSRGGLYLYDFASSDFFYTSAATFPYLYDFGLGTILYYYPSNVAGHYSSNPRYFYDFSRGQFITK